jgi:DNA invertase Pin-like site-specific DNA recombinase
VDRANNESRVVEAVACPSCRVPAGSACRTRSGNTAFWYHTYRLVLIPQLGSVGQLAVPADRGPGAPWQVSAVPPLPVRIGYIYRPHPSSDASRQEEALTSAGCVRTYADEIAVNVAARPALDDALTMAAGQRRSAEGQQVIVVVHNITKLARHSRELIQLAAAMHRDGLCLQVLTGPLRGLHDPETDAPGLFGVLVAAAHLDEQYVTEKSKAGVRIAAAAGARGGRPRVVDADMLAEAHRLRDQGISVPQIARRLVIPAPNGRGRHPSLATLYRALAQPEPITSQRSTHSPQEEEHDDVMEQTSSTHAGRSDS